ncbi:Pre-mrna-processing factor [Thalictrum thalictroides]|uniref:Pre-mrna-processing factor n=1 Tax=Thalictrum thalictroides TaxID=46969 RepID=A0A7J6W0Z0_THATH|nr:Pre-mrna-processing factor [Thalictrum thalictroides]
MDVTEQSDQVSVEDGKLQALCMPSEANFDTWTSHIAEIEKTSPVDIEKISLVYEDFLSEFPLCYGYWRKYAAHKARLCTVEKVVEVYERAVQSATYSIDLWVDYCSFGMLLFEDPVNVRRLFERGISFIGKDYLCNLLWDKYIEFEYSQKKWSSLAYIYIRTLKYPTKNLHSYYDSFKKLVAIWEEERNFQTADATEMQSDGMPNDKTTHVKEYDDEDITIVIKDLLDPTAGLHRHNALQKYLSTGEQFYQRARELDAKICLFESRIRRPYFHVKPLDANQLENWHQYLDFVEMHGDFDWAVRLHERCLISCANYPEFWMRYVEFMETKGGREIANFALVRASQIFLKRVPAIHIFCARYKEKIGDVFGSRAAFHQCDSESDFDLIENVRREANMEKRLGNIEAAFQIYEEALHMVKQKKNSHVFSMLSIHFSRYKYMVTGNLDATRDVLIEGIQHLPHCKLLIEEFLKFEMMHDGPKKMNVVESFVTRSVCAGQDASQALSNKDCEDLSSLYIEFLDHCGTIHDVMKAWNRHRKLFPHSMRPTAYDHIVGRQDMVVTLPHHASGDENSRSLVPPLQLDQNLSVPEKADSQSDVAPTDESLLVGIDNPKEKQQLLPSLTSPKAMENSGQDPSKQNEETTNLVGEVANSCQAQLAVQEYPEGASEVQKYSDFDLNDNLRPPSLETLSLSPRNDETQASNPTTSQDCGTLRATPGSNESRLTDVEFSSSSKLTCEKSGSQVNVQSDYGLSQTPNDPSSLEMQPHSQPVLPTSNISNRSFVNEESWYRTNHASKALGDASTTKSVSPDSRYPRKLQRSPRRQYRSSKHRQHFGGHQPPCQPQTWQNPPLPPSNQAPNQHQMVAQQPPMQPHGGSQFGQEYGQQAVGSQPPVQHYGGSQCGQEYGQQAVGSQEQITATQQILQEQGTTQQNIEASEPAVSPCLQQNPSN